MNRAAYAEVLGGQQLLAASHLHRRVKQLGDRFVLDEAIAAIAEDRVVPHRILDGQADETANSKF